MGKGKKAWNPTAERDRRGKRGKKRRPDITELRRMADKDYSRLKQTLKNAESGGRTDIEAVARRIGINPKEYPNSSKLIQQILQTGKKQIMISRGLRQPN